MHVITSHTCNHIPPFNREDSRDNRSPSLHDKECGRCRCTGPAVYSRVWPPHRAARKQGRTVQEADGETGVSTGRAAESTYLTGRGAWITLRPEKSGGEASGWDEL